MEEFVSLPMGSHYLQKMFGKAKGRAMKDNKIVSLPKGFKNYYTNDQDFNVMFEALTIAIEALEFCSRFDPVDEYSKAALRRIEALGK